MTTPKLPVAVLISGGGTTLKNLLAKMAAEALPLDIRLVISSTPKAKGLQIARDAGIAVQVFERDKVTSSEEYGKQVFDACRDVGADTVVMGGFLKHVAIPSDYENNVINIHPGLIPAFCGKGMYGHHVHEAVLDYGAKISGCTVHFVDNQYDHGPIIHQEVVPVLDGDTADTLAARVFEAECRAYPIVLRWIAEGRVTVDGRRVRVRAS